jgi:uncharacterized protein (TIGR01777 family)
MPTTLLTGGTGFIGNHLLPRLEHSILTTRNAESAKRKISQPNTDFIEWKPSKTELVLPADKPIDSIVNLMGESIAEGRWTDAKKKRIVESRVDATRSLVDAVLRLPNLPRTLVAASAVGIYGDAGETIVDEDHPAVGGFIGDLCKNWEAENLRLDQHGVRVVLIRIGIVLGRDGGALEKLIPMFKWGLGGKLGTGKQWMPWIHVTDLVSMIEWAIKTETVSGPVNGVAPNPVRNSTFTTELARSLGRFAILPAPKFGLRLALGEFSENLLNSQRVVPTAALSSGFEFTFPDIKTSLSKIVNS